MADWAFTILTGDSFPGEIFLEVLSRSLDLYESIYISAFQQFIQN